MAQEIAGTPITVDQIATINNKCEALTKELYRLRDGVRRIHYDQPDSIIKGDLEESNKKSPITVVQYLSEIIDNMDKALSLAYNTANELERII